MAFDQNVFVNCPFDNQYRKLLRPLLFTISYLGLTPRIALEAMDSGKVRIDRIVDLVRESKYAIHDLSRLQAEKAGEYARLNMPFELGLDLGARYFGQKLSDKKCLVLEAQPYRYQAAISDLSGSDILHHNNEPARVVVAVRDWLNNVCNLNAPGSQKIWTDFNIFMSDLTIDLQARGFSKKDVNNLQVSELVQHIIGWVAAK